MVAGDFYDEYATKAPTAPKTWIRTSGHSAWMILRASSTSFPCNSGQLNEQDFRGTYCIFMSSGTFAHICFASNNKDLKSVKSLDFQIYYFWFWFWFFNSFLNSNFFLISLLFISHMVAKAETTISSSIIFAYQVNHIFHEEQQGYHLRSGCSQ